MLTPDPQYLPQAKKKNKTLKAKRVNAAPSFPTQIKKIETKSLKKKAPFGNNHVWSN